MIGASLLLAVAAGPTYEFAEATVRQLLDVQSYSEAVLSGGGDVDLAEVRRP